MKLQQESKYDEAIASYKKAIAVNANEPAYYYAMLVQPIRLRMAYR
ncbi:MAG: tetratricopeptide repeat protein [Cyanobacteriota/Melainabacteria group bacterium]